MPRSLTRAFTFLWGASPFSSLGKGVICISLAPYERTTSDYTDDRTHHSLKTVTGELVGAGFPKVTRRRGGASHQVLRATDRSQERQPSSIGDGGQDAREVLEPRSFKRIHRCEGQDTRERLQILTVAVFSHPGSADHNCRPFQDLHPRKLTDQPFFVSEIGAPRLGHPGRLPRTLRIR